METHIAEEKKITQNESVLYTAKTHTTGGRDGGSSKTSDGRLDIKLSVPGTPGNGHQSGAIIRSWLVSLFHRCNENRSW